MDDPSSAAPDSAVLHAALTRTLHRRTSATGQLTLPAVPGLIDEYVTMSETIFAAMGRKFSPDQLANAKTLIENQLSKAFAASHRSSIVISFDAPLGTMLNYNVRPEWMTIEAVYDNWVATREPPLFGTEPDARVWALAEETADPTFHKVLDIGAGTGRNGLALARRGHPVDMIEMNAKFADMIRADAQRDGLDVCVIQKDVFATSDDLQQDYQLIVLAEVVPDFQTTQQLRAMFEIAARCLAPGGRLLFNSFLARPGYLPDAAAREIGQQLYTAMFTRDEVSTAAYELPLTLVADDSAYDYEKTHLPEGAWPPTGWYARWARGGDVFDVEPEDCPIALRWLVYQKAR